MKILYLRKSNIKNSNIRQNYLSDDSKQEHLLYSSNLNFDYDFKNINKELVIELPNELLDVVSSNDLDFKNIHDLYIDKFKNISSFKNVAASIHLNKNKTNLHLHLSYVDRDLVSKEHIAKKDMYIYSSTGKRIRDKSKYDESNPNHLKIAKDDALLDYSLIDNKTKVLFKKQLTTNVLSKAEQFDLRRYIKTTYKKIDSLEYSKAHESGLNILEQKKILKNYKKEFYNFSNELLIEYGFSPKYVSKEDFKKYGLETQKKIGKVIQDDQGNDKINAIQKNNILYNETVKKYNENILDIIYAKELSKEDKLVIISKERTRKKKYKKEKLSNNRKVNNMMNRICNLKAGILFLENAKEKIIERGKEFVQRVRDRRHRDVDETKGRERVKGESKEQKGKSKYTRKEEPELTL